MLLQRFFYSLFLLNAVNAQFDGSFWWTNTKLLESARESRENHNSAKVTNERTPTVDSDRRANGPHCVCVERQLCNKNNTLITDGDGLIDVRFSLCGNTDLVCCRLNESPSAAMTSSTVHQTTTLKPMGIPNKFSEQICGKKGLKIEKRILGHFDEEDSTDEDRGETQFGEFPWMLALMKLNKATGRYEYKCGAVLIRNNVALTVTHCVGKKNIAHNFKIRAGDWDRSSSQEYLPHQDRTLIRIINHPHFYPGSLYNDLSILVWNEPLQYDVNIGNICLPSLYENFDNKKCVVTGWGSAAFDPSSTQTNPNTEILRFLQLNVVNQYSCQDAIQTFAFGRKFKLHESFLCAGGEAGKDTCKGDGGSPLVCEKNGKYVLAGLVSWGVQCGLDNVPGVYTNIPYLSNWISDELQSIRLSL